MDNKGPPQVTVIKVKPSDGEQSLSLPPLKVNQNKAIKAEIIKEHKKSQVFVFEPQKLPKVIDRRVPCDRIFREIAFNFVPEKDAKINKCNESDSSDSDIESVSSYDDDDDIIFPTNETAKNPSERTIIPGVPEIKADEAVSDTKEDKFEENHEKSVPICSIEKSNKENEKQKVNKKEKKQKKDSDKAVVKNKGAKEEPEIKAMPSTPTETKQENEKKKKSKLPGCLGFISTWLAKRKEKRREKKRKAIAARAPTPTLVQYHHKKAPGGESFVIEIDGRPTSLTSKPVLPPIERADGPIRLGADDRLQKAEARRNEELDKKKGLSREHERKRAECKQRKDEADFHFRKKARLTVRYRQADAERNRSRLASTRSYSRMSAKTRHALAYSSSEESVADEGNKKALKVGSSH